MKVVFLLDNNEYVEVAPERLQIRQIAPGQSALGLEITVPVRNEEGVATVDADGKPVTQTGFRPFINYAVNLTVPTKAELDALALAAAQAAPVAQVPEATPMGPGKKSKGKASAAKRRPN
jgi:hypothetical protein